MVRFWRFLVRATRAEDQQCEDEPPVATRDALGTREILRFASLRSPSARSRGSTRTAPLRMTPSTNRQHYPLTIRHLLFPKNVGARIIRDSILG